MTLPPMSGVSGAKNESQNQCTVPEKRSANRYPAKRPDASQGQAAGTNSRPTIRALYNTSAPTATTSAPHFTTVRERGWSFVSGPSELALGTGLAALAEGLLSSVEDDTEEALPGSSSDSLTVGYDDADAGATSTTVCI